MPSNQELLFIMKMRDEATRVLNKTGAATKRLGNDVRRTTARTKGFNRELRSVQANALKLRGALAGIGIGFGLREAIGGARDFQTSLQQTVALTNATADEVANFRQEILKLGPAVGKSPQELADAMFVVSSAGLRGADALKALESAAKASVAGFGEVNDIARLVAAAMFNFGDSGLTAAKATDILIATGREGNFVISELGGSMARVLPLASAMGVSFDEVGAAIAGLTKGGFGASESVSRLNAFLVAITRNTPEVSKRFEEIAQATGNTAITLDDVQQTLRQRGLLAAMKQLSEFANDDASNLNRLLQSSEAVVPILALLGKNSLDTTRAFEALANSMGATEEAFNIVSQTSAVQMAQALATIEAAVLQLGNEALPVASRALKGLAENLDLVAIALVGLAAGGLTRFALTLSGPLIASIGAFVTGVRSGVGALAALRVALAASPFGLIATGAGLAVTAILLVNKSLRESADQARLAKTSYEDLAGAYDTAEQASKDLKGAIISELNERRKSVELAKQERIAILEVALAKAQERAARVAGEAFTAQQIELGKRVIAQARADGEAVGKAFEDAIESGVFRRAGIGNRQIGLLQRLLGASLAAANVQRLRTELDGLQTSLIQIQELGTLDPEDEEDLEFGRLLKASQARNDARKRNTAVDKDAIKAREQLEQRTIDLLTSIEAEGAALGMTASQRELFNAAMQLGIDIRNRDTLSRQNQARVQAIQDALADRESRRQTEAARVREIDIRAIKSQTAALGLSTEERELQVALIQLEAKALKEKRPLTQQEVDQTIRLVRARQQLTKRTKEIADAEEEARERALEWQRVQEDLTKTITSGFEDAIVEGKKLSEVFQSLERDILRILTRVLITKPLENSLTGLLTNKPVSGGITSPIPFLSDASSFIGRLFEGPQGQALRRSDVDDEDDAALLDAVFGSTDATEDGSKKVASTIENFMGTNNDLLTTLTRMPGACECLPNILGGGGGLGSDTGGFGIGSVLSDVGGFFHDVAFDFADDVLGFTFHRGGVVGKDGQRRYHEGGVVGGLAAGERQIIAQDGERVLSRAQNRMFEQKGGMAPIVNMTVVAQDADSFNRSRPQILAGLQSGLNKADSRNN